MTNSNMTCEEFDAALPDYLEGTLGEPLRAAVQKHLSECVRCASLVRDLEKIRTDAAALPDMVPSRDLWQGIEARIAAPVIPLAARPERQRRFAPAWLGIAAAALIVSTAGITYLLTARSLQSRPAQVAVLTPVGQAAQPTGSGDSGSSPSAEPSDVGATNTQRTSTPRGPVVGSASTPRQAGKSAAVLASRPLTQPQSEGIYSREIAMLQLIVTERKTQLDSATVATIERNLRIIDAAIAQSKDALAKDPASRLLSDQLTHALDKKVELLRTAAFLPAST